MIYPSIDYIRTETGEDMTINAGNELKAKAEIKQYTNYLLGELKLHNTIDNFHKVRKLIENEWNDEWKSAVASFIYEDYNTEKDKKEIAQDIIKRDRLLSIRNVIIR